MSAQDLQSLAGYYPASDREGLFELARVYDKRREQEILDVAAVAADVAADSILNLGLEPESNPLLLEAFRLQYPHVDMRSLVGASQERLDGLANGVKGKYFELLVVERLNGGEHVGELSLVPGQIARLAESTTQPGWDVEIVNPDGSIAEQIQNKATNSMSYIKQAYEKHPDFRIATTSEVDGTADEILQTNISNEYLTETTNEQLGELSEDAITDALYKTAELAFDVVPIFSAVLITVTEGRAVLAGRSSMKEALHRGAKRLGKASVFSSIGATLVALDAGGIVSVPTTVAARIAWGRMINRIKMGDILQTKTEAIRSLAAT